MVVSTLVACLPGQTGTPAATAFDPANLDYPSMFSASGRVRLVDGRYREPAAPGSASALEVELMAVAQGDLDNDGQADAAVVLATSGGGSGRFYELVPVIRGRAGQATGLGDRIELQSVTIEAGEVRVVAGTRRANDPMSSITAVDSWWFVLSGQALVLQD